MVSDEPALRAAMAEAVASGSAPSAEVLQGVMEVIASTSVGAMLDEEDLRKEAEHAILLGMAPPAAPVLRSEIWSLWRAGFEKSRSVLEWAKRQSATAVGVGGTMSLILLDGYVVELVHWSNGPPRTTSAPQVVQIVKVDSAQRIIFSTPAIRPQHLISGYHVILASTGTVHRKVPAHRRPRLPDEVAQLRQLWITSALHAGVLCEWCGVPSAEGVSRCCLCELSYHASCVRRARPFPDAPCVQLPECFRTSHICEACRGKCIPADSASGSRPSGANDHADGAAV